MKKKTLVLVAMLLLVAAVSFAGTTSVRCKTPILIVSGGQSVDGETVGILLKRVKIPYNYDPVVEAKNIDWDSFNTLIMVIGGSGKGLGGAGVSITEEEARVKAVLDAAKSHKKQIITMHIGGQDRRGSNSVPFLPYASYGDLLIVNKNGNGDGYFTKLAADKKIPFIEVAKNTELANIFTEVFGK